MSQKIMIMCFDAALRRLMVLLDTAVPDAVVCEDKACVKRECGWFGEVVELELRQMVERTQVLIDFRADVPFTLESAEFGSERIVGLRSRIMRSMYMLQGESVELARSVVHNMMQLVNLELSDEQRGRKWRVLKGLAKIGFASDTVITSGLEAEFKGKYGGEKVTDDELRDFVLRNAVDETEVMRFMSRCKGRCVERGEDGVKPTFRYVWYETEQKRLKKFFEMLKQKGWIPDRTKLFEFSVIFSGEEIVSKVVWLGQLGDLYYMIKSMLERGLISAPTKNGHWEVVSNHFVDANGGRIGNLHDQRVPRKNVGEIDRMINYLDVNYGRV